MTAKKDPASEFIVTTYAENAEGAADTICLSACATLTLCRELGYSPELPAIRIVLLLFGVIDCLSGFLKPE